MCRGRTQLTLDRDVGLSDTHVMTEDIPRVPASPFFDQPPTAPRPMPRAVPIVVERAALVGMDSVGMEREMVRILAAIRRRTPDDTETDPRHADGSLTIDSMTAVCLIATVGRAFGRPRLINLGKVDRDELRSVKGVSRLTLAAVAALVADGAA